MSKTTTALAIIKKVSGIKEHVVDALYDVCGVEQPCSVDVKRSRIVHPACRFNNKDIGYSEVLCNQDWYTRGHHDVVPEYIVEDVELTEHITIKYTYNKEMV